jgi:hypothetical protein
VQYLVEQSEQHGASEKIEKQFDGATTYKEMYERIAGIDKRLIPFTQKARIKQQKWGGLHPTPKSEDEIAKLRFERGRTNYLAEIGVPKVKADEFLKNLKEMNQRESVAKRQLAPQVHLLNSATNKISTLMQTKRITPELQIGQTLNKSVLLRTRKEDRPLLGKVRGKDGEIKDGVLMFKKGGRREEDGSERKYSKLIRDAGFTMTTFPGSDAISTIVIEDPAVNKELKVVPTRSPGEFIGESLKDNSKYSFKLKSLDSESAKVSDVRRIQ